MKSSVASVFALQVSAKLQCFDFFVLHPDKSSLSWTSASSAPSEFIRASSQRHFCAFSEVKHRELKLKAPLGKK